MREILFGMYLFHYLFVVWLQYALLGVALFAIGKAMIVFGGTLLLAWATTIGKAQVPRIPGLIANGAPAAPPGSYQDKATTVVASGVADWRLSGDIALTLATKLTSRARSSPPVTRM